MGIVDGALGAHFLGWHITREGKDVYSPIFLMMVKVIGWLARLFREMVLNDQRVDFTLFMVEALENGDLIHEAPAIVGCKTPSALTGEGIAASNAALGSRVAVFQRIQCY
jgi:hypothetical protein